MTDAVTILKQLEHAEASADPDLVDAAVQAAFAAPDPRFAQALGALLQVDDHHAYEDIARLLQQLRSPAAVPALCATALAPPAHLELDDGRALARKCTWALADIGTAKARAALVTIAASSDRTIAGYAQRRLNLWLTEADRKG